MSIDLQWMQMQFPHITGLTPIGHGGQRVVLGGQHPHHGDVVLKVFYPNAEPERVLREIAAVQNIASPRIPRVFDSGVVTSPIGNLPWLLEERVTGTDLRPMLVQHGALQPRQVLRVGFHLLEALSAAEAMRIVHRDVKPDNVKLATDGSAWLLDFGFARHLDLPSLTATANPFGVGTAGYAPPEQARNRKNEIDGRADLFALGVTLYECGVGQNPLIIGTRDDLERLRRTETRPLLKLPNHFDAAGEFPDLVYAMTRIRPDHRPATVAEALDWMREICAKEGIN